MRFRFLQPFVGTLLCLVLTIASSSAQSGKDDEFHISAAAEFYVLHKYSHLKSHKAIAVSPTDGWDAYYSMRSASAAAKSALDTCNRRLRSHKLKSIRDKKCVLFDIDGKRTGRASPIGIPFGTTAVGEDRPWLYGKEWKATTVTRRGTMLLLHGCSGYSFNG